MYTLKVGPYLYLGELAGSTQSTLRALEGTWNVQVIQQNNLVVLQALHQDFKEKNGKVSGPAPHRIGKLKAVGIASIDSGAFGLATKAFRQEELRSLWKSVAIGKDLPNLVHTDEAVMVRCSEQSYAIGGYINQQLLAVGVTVKLLP